MKMSRAAAHMCLAIAFFQLFGLFPVIHGHLHAALPSCLDKHRVFSEQCNQSKMEYDDCVCILEQLKCFNSYDCDYRSFIRSEESQCDNGIEQLMFNQACSEYYDGDLQERGAITWWLFSFFVCIVLVLALYLALYREEQQYYTYFILGLMICFSIVFLTYAVGYLNQTATMSIFLLFTLGFALVYFGIFYDPLYSLLRTEQVVNTTPPRAATPRSTQNSQYPIAYPWPGTPPLYADVQGSLPSPQNQALPYF